MVLNRPNRRKRLQQTQAKLEAAEAALKASNPFAPTDLTTSSELEPQVWLAEASSNRYYCPVIVSLRLGCRIGCLQTAEVYVFLHFSMGNLSHRICAGLMMLQHAHSRC